MTPTVTLLYAPGVFALPPGYEGHPPDRLTSTPGDNLAEFAGKLAYDSLGKPKGRPSAAYHAHIRETGHWSVYAHAVETFEVSYGDPATGFDALRSLQCRPGVWVTAYGDRSFRFCASLRAVLDWKNHGVPGAAALVRGIGSDLGAACADLLRADFPMTLGGVPRSGVDPAAILDPCRLAVKRVAAKTPHEKWVSLYIAGVSRDLLGELVRHHWQVNPSVRSTRYCDESNSVQIVPPALAQVPGLEAQVAETWATARETYAKVFAAMTEAGADQKTARGAARAFLPGATETRLVYSLSEFQARHILSLRLDQATGAADAEIVRLAAAMRGVLSAAFAPAA